MFAACRSNLKILAIMLGIVAAHDALQFWKLTHHIGE